MNLETPLISLRRAALRAAAATPLNLHDDTFDCIRQYQFYQDEPGKAVLRVVPADPQRPPDRAHIARGFAAKFNGRVQLTIEVCDRIKLTKSGKFSLIDQRIRKSMGAPTCAAAVTNHTASDEPSGMKHSYSSFEAGRA